jgi:hypothetical protein
MTIRQSFYLVCSDCNNQFVDSKYGGQFCSPEEAKETAMKRGWKIDVLVPNGSLWDFCPRCAKENPASDD